MLTGCGDSTLGEANPFRCQDLGEPGPYGKALDTTPCCTGLENVQFAYDKLESQGEPYCSETPGYQSFCIACGDHICDADYEDECVCPEDCGKIPRDRYIRSDRKTLDGEEPDVPLAQ